MLRHQPARRPPNTPTRLDTGSAPTPPLESVPRPTATRAAHSPRPAAAAHPAATGGGSRQLVSWPPHATKARGLIRKRSLVQVQVAPPAISPAQARYLRDWFT